MLHADDLAMSVFAPRVQQRSLPRLIFAQIKTRLLMGHAADGRIEQLAPQAVFNGRRSGEGGAPVIAQERPQPHRRSIDPERGLYPAQLPADGVQP